MSSLPATLRGNEGKLLGLPAGVRPERLAAHVLRATRACPWPVVSLTSKGLRLGNVVGIVQAGPVQLEILPKTSANSTHVEDQGFLLDLLDMAGLAPRLFSTRSGVQVDSPVLLDSAIHVVATHLWNQLLSGAPRRYHELRESCPTIRGRVDMRRMAARLPASDHVVPVVHWPLQRDNPLGRLLLATVLALQAMTRSLRNRQVLAKCEMLLDSVRRVPLTRSLVSQVRLNRYEQAWQEIVDFAALLVGGKAPSVVSAGEFSFFGFIFPLSDLFESIIRLSLPKALEGSSSQLRAAQDSLRLLQSLSDGYETLTLRPDYLFHDVADGNKPTLVADAKWKELDQAAKGFGVDRADVYQVATYMARHNLSRGLLLFPEADWMREVQPVWSHKYRATSKTDPLTT